MLGRFLNVFKEIVNFIFKPFGTFHNLPDYEAYWQLKSTSLKANFYQRDRFLLAKKFLESGSTVLDVGCGTCWFGGEAQKLGLDLNYIGVDSNPMPPDSFLCSANSKTTILTESIIPPFECLDKFTGASKVVLAFEVVEHFLEAEKLVLKLLEITDQVVLFSVPNSAYLPYRIRLGLLGRFPKQWRVWPGEHARFWSLIDLRDWLSYLVSGRAEVSVVGYGGIPGLQNVFPNLFSAGAFVVLTKIT